MERAGQGRGRGRGCGRQLGNEEATGVLCIGHGRGRGRPSPHAHFTLGQPPSQRDNTPTTMLPPYAGTSNQTTMMFSAGTSSNPTSMNSAQPVQTSHADSLLAMLFYDPILDSPTQQAHPSDDIPTQGAEASLDILTQQAESLRLSTMERAQGQSGGSGGRRSGAGSRGGRGQEPAVRRGPGRPRNSQSRQPSNRPSNLVTEEDRLSEAVASRSTTGTGRGRGRGRGGRGGGRGGGRSNPPTFPSPPTSSDSDSDESRGSYDSEDNSDTEDEQRHSPVRNQRNLAERINEIEPGCPALYTMQKTHRSEEVLKGNNPEALKVRKHCLKRFVMDPKYVDYIVNAGFYGLVKIGYICADRYLITALVERWRPETHTFHLPVGEMMVTLQDVAVILGLPIDGKPLLHVPKENERTDLDWHRMIRRYLGRDVDAETFRPNCKTAISIKWLKKHFRQLPPQGFYETDEEYEYKTRCYVRAVLLMMMGSSLFTDLSGDSISVLYLPFLRDLSKVSSYSWGAAALAYLNRELCRACRTDTHQMGGPILLLQIWAWERFLLGRPEMRNGIPKPVLGGFLGRPEYRPPFGYVWSGLHDWTKNPARVLQYYRDELDYLREYQVNWTPYEEIYDLLPPMCTASKHLWNYSGPLIHFWMVEPYNTRRVQRQFNKYQHYPPTPCDVDEFRCANKRPNESEAWKYGYARSVRQWANRHNLIFRNRRRYNRDTYYDYMEWYANTCRLYIQPEKVVTRQYDGPIRDLLYQVRASVTHETATKIKELGKECKEKIDEGAEGSLKEFALKMLGGLKDVLVHINEYVPSDPIFAPLNEVQHQPPQPPQAGGGQQRGGPNPRPGKRQRVRGG